MNLQLIDKTSENQNAVSFSFKPEGSFEFKPGQFMRYRIPKSAPDERGENRFFSISAAPFENKIMITTRINHEKSSSFKKDLSSLEIGDTIEAEGPKGSFTLEDSDKEYVFISEGKKLCFIAGGIGITPFRSMLLDLDKKGKPLNITLLYANRTKDAFFKGEFEALAKKHPEFKIYYFISKAEKRAERPIVSEEAVEEKQISENIKIIPGKVDETLLKSFIFNLLSLPPKEGRIIFYVSGPEPMVEEFEEMLGKIGIPKENIKRDYFPGYTKY